MIEVARIRPQPRDVCAVECGAKCCRSPKAQPIVRQDEMRQLKTIAGERGLHVTFRHHVGYQVDGHPHVLSEAQFYEIRNAGWRGTFRKVTDRWQLQHQDGACPFLDRERNLCGVYEDRPGICRDFPTQPVQGCLLNPGRDGDPGL